MPSPMLKIKTQISDLAFYINKLKKDHNHHPKIHGNQSIGNRNRKIRNINETKAIYLKKKNKLKRFPKHERFLTSPTRIRDRRYKWSISRMREETSQ